MHEPLFIIAALASIVACAEWLTRFRPGRLLGAALLSIVLGALLSNSGVLPKPSAEITVYGTLLGHAASLSIFLMLLEVRLAALRKAGAAMLGAFALGAAGTLLGVLGAYWATGIGSQLGSLGAPVAGMFVATYIGGSANFNALALHYDLAAQANLFAGANAVDNVVTTLWIVALLIIPGWILRHRLQPDTITADAAAPVIHAPTTPAISLHSLAALIALALVGHWLSLQLAGLAAAAGAAIPAVLILTTLALAAAQLPAVQRLAGAQTLGTYGAYLFLAVIGVYCDFGALAELGWLGLHLLLFVALAVSIHGLVVFGLGTWMRMDPALLALASSANIGGATTALPIASGLKRMDLLLPGILAGTLGTGLGTYAGFAVVWSLS
jgi:uncharacterized membrane protein